MGGRSTPQWFIMDAMVGCYQINYPLRSLSLCTTDQPIFLIKDCIVTHSFIQKADVFNIHIYTFKWSPAWYASNLTLIVYKRNQMHYRLSLSLRNCIVTHLFYQKADMFNILTLKGSPAWCIWFNTNGVQMESNGTVDVHLCTLS